MYSFTDWNGLAKDFKFIGLANYIEAFTNKRFQNAVLFNIKFTILAVILVVGTDFQQRYPAQIFLPRYLFLPSSSGYAGSWFDLQ